MIPISLTHIREAAAHRPPGYAEEVISRGQIKGDLLFLDENVYAELREKYSGGATHRLGDKIERLVKPIAKALKLPCLDKDGNLIPGTPCAKRRDKLNKL